MFNFEHCYGAVYAVVPSYHCLEFAVYVCNYQCNLGATFENKIYVLVVCRKLPNLCVYSPIYVGVIWR